MVHPPVVRDSLKRSGRRGVPDRTPVYNQASTRCWLTHSVEMLENDYLLRDDETFGFFADDESENSYESRDEE